MRALGLDLGSKTIGVALSDLSKLIASTLTTIYFEEDNYEAGLSELLKLLETVEVDEIVLGLPKHMNGDIGERGQISLSFKVRIEEETGLPVILWDERLSTQAATRTLIAADVSRKKRKKVVDQMAAVLILQGYLDSRTR